MAKAPSAFQKYSARKWKKKTRAEMAIGVGLAGVGTLGVAAAIAVGEPYLAGSSGTAAMHGLSTIGSAKKKRKSAAARATAIADLSRRGSTAKARAAKAKAVSDGMVKGHYRTMPNGITTFVKPHKRNR